MDNPLLWIFVVFTVIGVGYFVFAIIFGDIADGVTDSEFGLLLAAAFSAGFGAFGLLGTLSQWSLPVTLAAAVIFGYLLGKAGSIVLRFVLRQQTEGSIHAVEELVGLSGRVTIDSPAGKIGEIMLEGALHVTRSAAKEVSGAALKRGDMVQVVRAETGLLYVKKKNG